VRRAYQSAAEQLGQPLYGAAIFPGDPARVPWESLDAAAMEASLRANYVAPILLAKELGSQMEQSGQGSIVLLATMQAVAAFDSSLNYAAPKAALVHAAHIMAKEWGGRADVRVNVVAQQFAWSFYYPAYGNKRSDILRLPVHRSVVLKMTSKDVVHSFWVPEFSQKQDVVPGIHPTLHITPTRLGTYPVVCTELCGLGHALMRSQTIVMKQADFKKWAAKK